MRPLHFGLRRDPLQPAGSRLQVAIARVAPPDLGYFVPGIERLCGFNDGRRRAVWGEVEANRIKRIGAGIDMFCESHQCPAKRPAVCQDEVCNAVSYDYRGWTVWRFLSAKDWHNQPSLRRLMEVSKRMGIPLCLSFVGGVIPRRADLEFDESDDPRREQHNVQPLPEAKQGNLDENDPISFRPTNLRERVSEEFDFAFPSADLLSFGGGMKRNVPA